MLTTLRGCSYSVVLGRAVKTEFLALGTLVGTAAVSYAAASGGSKEAPKTSLQEVKDAVKIDSSSKCVSEPCLDFLAVLWSDWHVSCASVLRFCVCREEEDLYVLRLCCVAYVCGSRLSEWIASRPSSQRQRRSQNTECGWTCDLTWAGNVVASIRRRLELPAIQLCNFGSLSHP